MISFLEEVTGKDREEILAAARAEFERMVEDGRIIKLETPYGTFICLDHPLLRKQ